MADNRIIKGYTKQGDHLDDTSANMEWMKSVYSTTEYWSDDLRYGYRWNKNRPIKDYRHTSQAIEKFLVPFLPPVVDSAVEIGPGGGRWTTELLRIAANLTLVDLSDTAIEVCRERFKYYDNIDYHVTESCTLPFIPDNSMDLVFSWGVFVHIEKQLIAGYFREFERVIKPGGRIWVQHGALGTHVAQSRSNFTNADMDRIAEDCGLTIAAQIMTSKGFYTEYKNGETAVYLDTISVLEKNESNVAPT